MSFFDNTRSEVIDRLVSYVLEKLPKDQNQLVQRFIKLYYINVAPEDLTSRTLLDLYGAAISHWQYINKRYKSEDKVRVYNPHLETHGWQSNHTVIEIVTNDMPFLEDSVAMALHRLEINIHLIHSGTMKVKRNAQGEVIDLYESNIRTNGKTNKNKNGYEFEQSMENQGSKFNTDVNWVNEAAVYVEIDKQTEAAKLIEIDEQIKKTLHDVRVVVEGWSVLKNKALETVKEYERTPAALDKEQLLETIAFLNWLIDDHFTFMGYCEFRLNCIADSMVLQIVENTKLGLVPTDLWPEEDIPVHQFPSEAQEVLLGSQMLVIGKTNLKSTVHRPTYTDFVAIKIFDDKGHPVGWHRFIGLFTSVAYTSRPKQLPFIRRKVEAVLKESGFLQRSHDERILMNILETLPREELFQDTVSELINLSSGIFRLQERQKIRLFIRKDIFGLFFSCYVFVPREAFNSQLRERMQKILLTDLKGYESDFSTRFSESSLARIHFIIRIYPLQKVEYNIKELEAKLVETARTWEDDLRDMLLEHMGEAYGNELLKKYQTAFPASYKEFFSALQAVSDIQYFEKLSENNPLLMSLYHPLEEDRDTIRFKLFRCGATLPLSDVVPILENMGLRIISERPYQISPKNSKSIWINDYRMLHTFGEYFDVEEVKNIFQEAFEAVWWCSAENDGFNKLVLSAQLNWREITVLRAYAKYLWQAGFSFSSDHVEDAISRNPELAFALVTLFKKRFHPHEYASEEEIQQQKLLIENLLENVSNSNEDKIIRRYMDVIMATLRTNYFQKKDGNYKTYYSFKLQSANVPELPLPLPLYEIFVYSTRMEGIHLRAAKVARGGIRWSDRREDFRTEILDLMKTQQVKNAVIVPMGAKGGFVVKKDLTDRTREEIMDEVIFCYKTLIYGLLDITDNSTGTEIIPPLDVRRYDEDDTYLVVAADKGTATFSDIANAISKEYGFWLNDAFASGGSTGYDHKKMGITARGAWESVKQHFLGMNIDIQNTSFTAIGIGDMSGDVFGNGMLLSNRLRLVAAFNHQHIFLDPEPDPLSSFAERKRLFELPRSSWADYNPAIISKGGGVFLRSAKLIILTPEVQKSLDFYYDKVSPVELIRAILRAPVDLFWNGGIGTYVKATRESNISVGDRTNDMVRVNGAELRCKVVGEGGNLGFTQLGRVEFAKCGGRLNTDAIDNSGGVNCSDNEVNIKILLNAVVKNGELTEKQRNQLLASMQEEVAELVLNNNRLQPEAISITESQASANIEMHSRLIYEMERHEDLNRVVEFLPDKDEIENRKKFGQGLTRPEIAVLMAYCKIVLKKNLLNSTVPDEPFFLIDLLRAFPTPLQLQYQSYMKEHHLKREIIATQLSNSVINDMGINFIHRLQDETGMEAHEIVRAHTVAKIIFDAQGLYTAIQDLNGIVDVKIQLRMIQEINRLIRRGTRWFLQNRRTGLNIEEAIQQFLDPVAEISQKLVNILSSSTAETDSLSISMLKHANVPEHLAIRISQITAMFSALDIAEAARQNNFNTAQVAAIYYAVGTRLQLDWFRELIKIHPIHNHWEALARATFRDDLDKQQRNLTVTIMQYNGLKLEDPHPLIDNWFKNYPALIRRWEYFLTELKNTPNPDFTMFAISLRELLDISQISMLKPKDNKI